MATLSQTARGDRRRAEIVDSARACFIANGFHATSMQDLLKAADISAGAFYRYFPSKEALVAAIAGSVVDELADALEGDAPESLRDLLNGVIGAVEALDRKTGTPRLAVQLWGEAQRDPRLAATVAAAFARIVGWFTVQVAVLRARGVLSEVAAPEDVARVAAGIVQGFMVQRALTGISAAAYCKGLAG